MSMVSVIWQETEYRDQNLMEVLRRAMVEGYTGQIVLNVSQGRVLSLGTREKVPNGNGNGNGHKKDFLDIPERVAAHSEP